MSPERRYDEQEIAAIFKQAATDQESAQRHLPHTEGLTLAELQQIGKEAGITPEFIARSAAAVDRTDLTQPPTRFLGLPISVGRTVDLPGPLSDENWDRLVVELRETFQARGKRQRDGSLREWKNGNLHAVVEPTESGHRLRLRTVKGNAKRRLLGGLAAFAFGLAFLLPSAFTVDFLTVRMMVFTLISVIGLASMGLTAFRLPRWAREGARQMEAIAARAVELAGGQGATALREVAPSGRVDLDLPTDPAEAEQTRMKRRTRS